MTSSRRIQRTHPFIDQKYYNEQAQVVEVAFFRGGRGFVCISQQELLCDFISWPLRAVKQIP